MGGPVGVTLAVVLAVAAGAAPATAKYRNDRPPGYNATTGLTSPPLAWAPPPPLAFRGGRIVNADTGDAVRLAGVNWAGFNYGMEFFELGPHRASSLTGDFATVVYRQSLLGFNLVRIPFRFAALDAAPRPIAARCAAASRAAVKRSVINPLPPFASLPYDTWRLPSPPAPPPRPRRGAPACNWYVPDTTVRDRLLWAAQYYVANGFYVVLDYHPATPDDEAAADSALLADADALAAAWRRLAADVASLPAWADGRLKGRVLFDLINEPDRLGVAWNDATVGKLNATALARREASPGPRPLAAPGANASAAAWVRSLGGGGGGGGGSPPPAQSQALTGAAASAPTVAAASAPTRSARRLLAPPAPAAALAAGTYNYTQRPLAELLLAAGGAVVGAAPGALLIIQGTNQSHYTPPMAWGAAFMTDPAVAADHAARGRPYSDAAPMLAAWSARADLAPVTALGPHVYGPSLNGWARDDAVGARLWRNLDATFGGGSGWGAAYPVIIGEFGSHFEPGSGDAEWLADLAAWANGAPPAVTAAGHRPVTAWAWWQWAPTAWDTGGLVDDDWLTPRWDKIGALTTTAATAAAGGGGWWLAPWYVRAAAAARNATAAAAAGDAARSATAAAATARGPT